MAARSTTKATDRPEMRRPRGSSKSRASSSRERHRRERSTQDPGLNSRRRSEAWPSTAPLDGSTSIPRARARWEVAPLETKPEATGDKMSAQGLMRQQLAPTGPCQSRRSVGSDQVRQQQVGRECRSEQPRAAGLASHRPSPTSRAIFGGSAGTCPPLALDTHQALPCRRTRRTPSRRRRRPRSISPPSPLAASASLPEGASP
jgi:hypothetical protein